MTPPHAVLMNKDVVSAVSQTCHKQSECICGAQRSPLKTSVNLQHWGQCHCLSRSQAAPLNIHVESQECLEGGVGAHEVWYKD